MKRKEGLEGLVTNFDDELDAGEDNGHSMDWYNVHTTLQLFLIKDAAQGTFNV